MSNRTDPGSLPNEGDKVYNFDRFRLGYNEYGVCKHQANGIINAVNLMNKTIRVYYYTPDGEFVTYGFDDFWMKFDPSFFGGTWVLGNGVFEGECNGLEGREGTGIR